MGIAILAMGGEGGSVLADWIVDLAEHSGYIAQTTSVPGVAQRTGATIYYVEIFSEAAARAAGREPVLALTPVPGDVELVVASELMEAGRAIERGLVTSDRTTLITSTHRVYSMTEKTAMADGRVQADAIIEACRSAAKRFVSADMQRLAENTNSVLSAVLFGAIAGSDALPFTRAQYETAIRSAGVGVDASLAAFAAGFRAVTEPATGGAVATPERARLDDLGTRATRDFPAAAAPTILEGVRRLIDYQDASYATQYLDRLAAIRDLDERHGDGHWLLLDEAARHLALWMSYEDTIRVADLKIRRSRFARVKQEVRLASDQLLRIKEYLHPRVQEIADTLPAPLGRWLLTSKGARRLIEPFTRSGRVIETTSLHGFLLLWFVAGLRRWRRGTLRFAVEHARIDAWLARIGDLARSHYALAIEVARCQQLVKGYGETHERGTRNFERLMGTIPALEKRVDGARLLADLQTAALADEGGATLMQTLRSAELSVNA